MRTRTWTIAGPILGLLLVASFGDAAFLKPSPDSKAGSVRPRLSIGPGGHISLVWAEERDGRSQDIFFNRSTDQGKTWQKEDRWLDQDKPAGSRSSAPQMHNDGKGHVYVVWRTKHQDGKKDILFTASKDFGATFGPKRKLNRGDGAFAPEISADGKGHVYVVWPDERAEGTVGGEGKKKRASHHIYFTRSDDHGESWPDQEIKLNGGPEDPSKPVMRGWPQIRSDDQGHVSVAWFDNRDGWGTIYFRASGDFGKTWQEERRLKEETKGDILGPIQMAGDDQGHLYVAWADNREGEYDIYLVASADFGRTWSKEVRLNAGRAKAARAMAPALAADDRGHIYVAWQDARHGGWDIYLNLSSDFGRTWLKEEIRLNTGPPGEAEAQWPHIALDGKGHVVVIWQENRGAEQEEGIYLTWSADFGRTWLKDDIRVDEQQPGQLSLKPQIAVLPQGTFVAAWEVERKGRKDIALKVLDLGARRSSAR